MWVSASVTLAMLRAFGGNPVHDVRGAQRARRSDPGVRLSGTAAHDRRLSCLCYFDGGDGAAGRSELHVSTIHFQLPSGCFFQISTFFPTSLALLPPDSFHLSS